MKIYAHILLLVSSISHCCYGYGKIKACEHLAIQISNQTNHVCILDEGPTPNHYTSHATVIPISIRAGESRYFILAPTYQSLFGNTSSLQLQYKCGPGKVRLESSNNGCNTLPTYDISYLSDDLEVKKPIVFSSRNFSDDPDNVGYGSIYWTIQSKTQS